MNRQYTISSLLGALLLVSLPSSGYSQTVIAEPGPLSRRTTVVANSAQDLIPLNPDRKRLDVPGAPADVDIKREQPITLEAAFELARRNNRDIQVAELELQQSQAALQAARAALLPTVSATASLTRTDSAAAQIGIDQQEEDLGIDIDASSVSNIFTASAQATHDVYTSGQRPASIRAAEAAVKAAADNLETELQDLRLDVANDYYDLQQADELIRIAQSAVENSEKSLSDTLALERAGLGTRLDVLRAQVQLSDREQQLAQAISQKQIAQRQLSERLSLQENTTLVAATKGTVAGQWPLSLEESIVRALQNRSELAEVLEQRQIALQNQRLIKGSFGPQVTASGSISVAEDLGDDVSAEFGYSLGGQVNKLLFDGGATKANAKQQALNIKIAETQFAMFKNLIRFQVEQNYQTLVSSRQNICTNQGAVAQATESLRLARLRFQAGIGTQLEVSNAETDLTRAESNLLQAVIDYNRALVSLQRFVGTRTNEVSAAPPRICA